MNKTEKLKLGRAYTSLRLAKEAKDIATKDKMIDAAMVVLKDLGCADSSQMPTINLKRGEPIPVPTDPTLKEK